MAKTLLLLFAWTIVDTTSMLMSHQSDLYRDSWRQFWNDVHRKPRPNLLSSCPWEYKKLPNNTIRAQIYQFAMTNCIDLYKSGANGPIFYPDGKCQAIRMPVQGCGRPDSSVIVGFICVHSSDILASKRNSENNHTYTNQSFISETSSVFPSISSSSVSFITEKTEKPTHKPGDDKKDDGKLEETEEQHANENNNQNQVENEPLHQHLVPPFLKPGAMPQPAQSPMFLQNLQPANPPEIFFGNHNPQLGMPPLERPMTLMDLIKGSARSENEDGENW